MLFQLAEHYYKNGEKLEVTNILKKIIDIDPANRLIKQKVANFFSKKEDQFEKTTVLELEQWRAGREEKKDSGSFFDLESELDEDMTITFSSSSAIV